MSVVGINCDYGGWSLSPGKGFPIIITLNPLSGNSAMINTAPNRKVPTHNAKTVKTASVSHTWDNGDSSAECDS